VVTAWQSRALEPFYALVYLDAIVVKIRDGAHQPNRAAHIAVGVDMGDAGRNAMNGVNRSQAVVQLATADGHF
jgi:transposase-like protein